MVSDKTGWRVFFSLLIYSVNSFKLAKMFHKNYSGLEHIVVLLHPACFITILAEILGIIINLPNGASLKWKQLFSGHVSLTHGNTILLKRLHSFQNVDWTSLRLTAIHLNTFTGIRMCMHTLTHTHNQVMVEISNINFSKSLMLIIV